MPRTIERERNARRHSTAALAVAFAALFAALTGAATALPSKNTVDSGDIKNGEVKTPDLAARAVTSAKIGNRQVRAPDLAKGAVRTAQLGDVRRLGTPTDNPLELVVAGTPALRLEPALDGGLPAPNVIGGSPENSVADGVHSATIAGGGAPGPLPGGANVVSGDLGTVGGGSANRASENAATVGGGLGSRAGGDAATVAGGIFNHASGQDSAVGGAAQNATFARGATVAGGAANLASGFRAAVGGGARNTARGTAATVPGGADNTADGAYSFAAGRRADAVFDGTFVWADSSDFDFGPSRADQFRARATGGVEFISGIFNDDGASRTGVVLDPGAGAWRTRSDRRSKRDLRPVDAHRVLRRLAAMPVSTWSWKAQQEGIRHMGPTAQDFRDAFGLGKGRRTISTVDADGVALAAIKGLNRKLGRKLRAERRRRTEQGRRIARLERRLAKMEGRLGGS